MTHGQTMQYANPNATLGLSQTNNITYQPNGSIPAMAQDPADQFFDQWERELASQPPLAPVDYMSSSRQAMINAANTEHYSNEEDGRTRHAKKPEARGENMVALPFNRLK